MPIYPSSGVAVDNDTIKTNSVSEIEVAPSSITNLIYNYIFSSNTTLTADIIAYNITINSGVTVTTSGYNFYALNNFINNGSINANTTGTNSAGATGGAGGGGGGNAGVGGNITSGGVYIQAKNVTAGTITTNGSAGTGAGSGAATTGGGGGGSGGSSILIAYGNTYTAGTYTLTGGAGGSTASSPGTSNSSSGSTGGSTVSSGGTAGTPAAVTGGAGATPAIPTFTNSLIQTWKSNGFINYLAGGSGGGGGGNSGNGSAGTAFVNSYGGSGGGGGGYSSSSNTSGAGGAGGAGNIMTYLFSTPPIAIVNSTTNSNSNMLNVLNNNINRNYSNIFMLTSQNTTSTTAITIASQEITPSANGLGMIKISATVRASNNTIGDGVSVSLMQGSTTLDTDTYTQEGLASNNHTFKVSYLGYYTPSNAVTFSVTINAVTGGTAAYQLVEFEIKEIY